jgi:hypothetical protein
VWHDILEYFVSKRAVSGLPLFISSTLPIMKNISLLTLAFLTVAVLSMSAWKKDVSPQKISLEKEQKSLAAFNSMLKVIKHQRCMNCHPTDDHPRQGDGSHVHFFNVQRGEHDEGLPVMKCNTCHQKENNPYSNAPGAPHWKLAPKSMGWQGLTDAQLGQAILDKSKNKNRDVAALVEHMTKDSLVNWGFKPGVGRALPPLTQQEFAKAVHEWADNGAVVPK